VLVSTHSVHNKLTYSKEFDFSKCGYAFTQD